MSTGQKETEEARAFADGLERRLGERLAEIERSDVFATFTDANADARFVATVMKYVLLEIFSSGPHITEARVKIAIDRRKYLRRPRWAESQPVIGRIVALAAR